MTAESATYFTAIEGDECEALLRGAQVGRIAWGGPTDIQVLPVNYRFADGRITFHTRPASALAALVEPTPAVFEVDEIDVETAVGWSVVARGVTRASGEGASNSWMPDNRNLGVELVVESVSGRVVSGQHEQEG